MSNLLTESQRLTDLRQRARSRLSAGSRKADAWPSASVALGVLHQLASSPDKAADALALLHELQVHQVELDLQDEELRHSRIELEAALQRQQGLYEHAPFAYLVLDAHGSLREINQAGLHLLGLARHDLMGQPLHRWLSPGSADTLSSLLVSARPGPKLPACELELLAADGATHRVRAQASADPEGTGLLLALVDTPAG
ncbi:MAG: PAS domain-containing protein [Burkholderiales bacterium]|nr:PAS domain-containing protein [Burkholderiales bacterium]MBP6405228.1 PAS domain-containing protein [Ramlibacter sp.]